MRGECFNGKSTQQYIYLLNETGRSPDFMKL